MRPRRANGGTWRRHTPSLRPPPSRAAPRPLLPLRAPELNPQENIWQFMRANWLSNRIFKSFDEIVDHCCYAWNTLIDQPWKIMSIARRDWAVAAREVQRSLAELRVMHRWRTELFRRGRSVRRRTTPDRPVGSPRPRRPAAATYRVVGPLSDETPKAMRPPRRGNAPGVLLFWTQTPLSGHKNRNAPPRTATASRLSMTIVIPEIYHDLPVSSRPRLQRTRSDSAEFLILAVRGPLRRKGPFRGMARVNAWSHPRRFP